MLPSRPKRTRLRVVDEMVEEALEALADRVRPYERHIGDTDATLVAARDFLRRARERNRPLWPLALHVRTMFAAIPTRDNTPALPPLSLPPMLNSVKRALYRAAIGAPQ